MLSAVDYNDANIQFQTNVTSDAQALVQNELIEEIRTTIISHPYLDDKLEMLKKTVVPWNEYKEIGLITADEVAMIEHVENRTTEELVLIMAEHGLYYAALYLELMQKLARVDALQKILVLIHDMLNEHEERIELFHRAGEKVTDFPFGPFHKALRIGDEFIGIQSSKILTLLICSTSQRDIDIYEFFRWITFQLQSPHQHIIDLNIQILDALFHIPEYREAFWKTTHAIDSLVNILKKTQKTNAGPQKAYEIMFALWLLTFNQTIAENLDRKCRVIPTLVNLAKFAVKEKVIRVVIATFKNLIERAAVENIPAMLVAKLLPLCEHLSTRKWNDQEIAEDIAFVQRELQQSFQSLTTFEVYASELEAEMLQWSPSHSSENFWKQNAHKFNDNDQLLLKQLSRLLSSSTNPVILAVACHDIGQYVKYNKSDGKKYLQALGAKQRIMELMTHQDSNVRYQALCATQKYFAMTS